MVHGTPLTWSLSRHANVNDRIVPCRVHLPFKSRLLLLDPGGERERESEKIIKNSVVRRRHLWPIKVPRARGSRQSVNLSRINCLLFFYYYDFFLQMCIYIHEQKE